MDEFLKKMRKAKDISELKEVTEQFLSFLDGLCVATKNPIDKVAIITLSYFLSNFMYSTTVAEALSDRLNSLEDDFNKALKNILDMLKALSKSIEELKKRVESLEKELSGEGEYV